MRRLLVWLPALLVMRIIYFFSGQPKWPDVVQGEPRLGVALGRIRSPRGALAFGFSDGLIRRLSSLERVAAVAVGALHTGFDEWHQSLVPGRVADPRDVAVDLVGVALAVVLTALYLSGRGAPRARIGADLPASERHGTIAASGLPIVLVPPYLGLRVPQRCVRRRHWYA